jgi:hypothetical protein
MDVKEQAMPEDRKPRFIRGCYVVPRDKLHLHEPIGECPFRNDLKPKDREPKGGNPVKGENQALEHQD